MKGNLVTEQVGKHKITQGSWEVQAKISPREVQTNKNEKPEHKSRNMGKSTKTETMQDKGTEHKTEEQTREIVTHIRYSTI